LILLGSGFHQSDKFGIFRGSLKFYNIK
jgi:hypothetical protein